MKQTFEARFLSARRAVIAARFQNLNEMQREGVLTTQGPLLLLAGAGSGKTTVLINRIANLIAFGEGSDSNEIPEYIAEEDVTYLEDYLKTRDPAMQQQAERLCALRPAAPWSILAITFTNKAANELKARLQALLGDYAMDVWAMTFHAACCRILRREIDRLDGWATAFTKLGRRKALAISRLNTAVALRFDAGRITDARIAPGCVFAAPDRVPAAEQLLIGQAPSDALFAQAAEAVAQEMIARTGVRWSTAYKQPALTAVVVQTLHDAWEMAK